MQIQRQMEYHAERGEAEREGIMVWDQKGLVVRWPDGHCSRFLWATLRHHCLCPECRKQRDGQEPAPLNFPGGVTSPRAAYEPLPLP
jgi:hypothetical protein